MSRGTKGTLIADLVRNRLMFRPTHMTAPGPSASTMAAAPPTSHNGADQAMARDLLAALEERAVFPVTAQESMEAGLTVMAIDPRDARGRRDRLRADVGRV